MEEEVLGKAYDSRLMRRLLRYMKPYRLIIAASMFLLLVDSLLQVIGPLLTKLAVDRYLVPGHGGTVTLPWLGDWLATNPWTGLSQ